MPSLRPLYRLLHLRTRLLILLMLSALVATSTEGTRGDGDRKVEYYFAREIDFLARQSMLMGGYTYDVDDEVSRLRFIEQSLRVELDYVRRLGGAGDNAANSTNSTQRPNAATSGGDSDDAIAEKNETDIHNAIFNMIFGATWSSVASKTYDLPHASTTTMIEHGYDYDLAYEKGFAWMHNDLACTEHAYDQQKPLYTAENWKVLWTAFQNSTLFPFPIPEQNEYPDNPFYAAAHTTDNKGRGVFALRNITKGSLIHSGLPKTVFFLTNKDFYRFVTILPKMMACDVLEWAWQQDITGSGNVCLCLNMNDAVFFNDGGEKSNMEMKSSTSLDFWAARDIEKGEELLYHYDLLDFDTLEMDL